METVHDSHGVLVRMNSSGEVFVSNKLGVEVRVSPNYTHIIVTASGNNVTPWSVNGLPGIKVEPRE
jgi:hypothetical protein